MTTSRPLSDQAMQESRLLSERWVSSVSTILKKAIQDLESLEPKSLSLLVTIRLTELKGRLLTDLGLTEEHTKPSEKAYPHQ